MTTETETVMVYDYEYLDAGSGVWLLGPSAATMKAILVHAWRAVPASGRPAPLANISSNGLVLEGSKPKV